MTAKPAEDLSAAGNKCPPEGCLHRPLTGEIWPLGQFSTQPLLVVTCASMPVIESLTQLFSHYVPSSLTSHPQGYIKICSPKGSWKWDTLQPLIPLIHPHVHVKMVTVFFSEVGVVSKHLGLGSFLKQQISHMLPG